MWCFSRVCSLRAPMWCTQVYSVLPLAEAAKAHQRAEHRAIIGKVILVP